VEVGEPTSTVHRKESIDMLRLESNSRARAFTITEMLVTVGVIVILAGILITTLSKAARTAQQGRTVQLMNAINDAISRFETDHGYIPPVLGPQVTAAGGIGHGRDLLGLPPVSGANPDYQQQQSYYSLTSLPEFLLGYDDRRMDGFGYVPQGGNPSPPITLAPSDMNPGQREHPALGFRSPGPDGFWNATLNPRFGGGGNVNNGVSFASRNPGNLGNISYTGNNDHTLQGKVYGPYLDLKDDTVIGEVQGMAFSDDSGGTADSQVWDRVLLPGDAGYGTNNNPKVFLDYWGNPLRYYRRPPVDVRDPRMFDENFSLAEVIALRPSSFEPGADVNSRYNDANGDSSASRALIASRYALFSPGADGKSADDVRIDDDNDYNSDNIVETGK
jgi:type II secretory pathway pseudopilin PulG